MKVVILCGGKGTRLREETEFRPKPMVPIGDRPILWHIMKTYSHWGHRDFILCLGYKGEMIREYFRNYLWNTCDVTVSLGRKASIKYHNHHDEEDWTVTLAETGPESGTSGRLKLVQRYLDPSEPFLLTYGDGLCNVNVSTVIENHRKAGKLCTLTAVHPPGRFGALKIDEAGAIHHFEEKPQMEAGYINGGYMVCNPGVFDFVPEDLSAMFEREPIERLVEARQLNSYCHDGFWQPMDTFQEMNYLNQLWATSRAPWKVW